MKNFPSAHIFLALLIVCALCYAPLRAQTLDSTKAASVQKPRENWYWVHGSIGFTSPELTYWQCALSTAFNNQVISLRINRAFVPIAPIVDLLPGSYFAYTSEIGILYGLTAREAWSFTSISAGLAYTDGLKVGENGSSSTLGGTPIWYKTVGLIFEANASLKAYCIGLGISLIGNLNLYQSYVGLTLTAHLGWMP